MKRPHLVLGRDAVPGVVRGISGTEVYVVGAGGTILRCHPIPI
jgi:hypothetical protein